MKKIMIFAMIACMVMSLAGCAGGGSDTTTTAPSADGGFTFTYKGTEIALHAPAAPILEALGEPMKYTESASCAFEGLDKNYYFGSFYLDTYPKGEEDFVYGWWFADDSVKTDEGIYIGAAQGDVEAAYGADSYNGTNAYVVRREQGTLTIILEDGVVTSIQYAIVLED